MSPSGEPARLFVALWPDDAVRAGLQAFAQAWQWPAGARRVADANLHLTLHFIGAFARDAIGPLRDRLAAIPPRRFSLAPAGTAVWRGGIAVLLLRDDPVLTALHGEVGDALARAGIALDARPFAPHVTLARKAWHAGPPDSLPALEWVGEGFSLVESRPGPRYLRLAAWGRPALDASPTG